MEQVYDFIPAVNSHGNKHGYTLWATCLKETGELIGFIGLNYTDWKSHFTPAVEIGWRLGSQFWGKGFATEGAKSVLDYGFKKCDLKEIVSFTVPANFRSLKVMKKLGLKSDAKDDFDHPKLDDSSPLKRHVLYRLTRDDYLQTRLFTV
jgi:RimJ/RimL family protein N-acetyltransferase